MQDVRFMQRVFLTQADTCTCCEHGVSNDDRAHLQGLTTDDTQDRKMLPPPELSIIVACNKMSRTLNEIVNEVGTIQVLAINKIKYW